MRKPFVFFGLVLLCIWIGHSAMAKDGPKGKRLMENDLISIFGGGVGQILDGRTSSGVPWSIVTTPIGEAYGMWVVRGSSPRIDSGTWSIEKDMLCFKWKKTGGDAAGCFTEYLEGNNAYQQWLPEGTLQSTFSIRR